MSALDTLAAATEQITTEVQAPEVTTANIETNIYAESLDGLQQSIDSIFSAVMIGGIDRTNFALIKEKQDVFKQAYPKFKSMYTENVFSDEYAFLHSALTTLKMEVFTWPQLEIIIDNSADDILASSKIDLSNFATFNGVASTNEEKIEAFKCLVRAKFEALSNTAVTIEEFNSACVLYNTCYKEIEMTNLINDMAIIMSAGLSKKVGIGRKRVWKGADDAQEYYRRKIAILNSLTSDIGKIKEYVVDEKWLSGELEEKHSDDKQVLIDTGIKEIDSIHGGLHRGNMLEAMGPPKSGKTTYISYMVERCLDAGLNVAIWPLEGTKEEWLALLEACMLRKRGRKNIGKKTVLESSFDNDIDKQLIAGVKSELAIGKGRGKLSFIEGICYVEDLEDTLLNHYKTKNAFDVIVMDSPVLVLSRNSNKSKPDRIGEAYTTLKNFVNNRLARKALALVTAQLKQTVVDELRQNPTKELAETAGGESAETIRTPDYVLCLVSTKEERRNNLVKFQDVAVRHTDSFKPFYARAEYGCAYFYSDDGLNNI